MLKFNAFSIFFFLWILLFTTGCPIKDIVDDDIQKSGCNANFIVDEVKGSLSISDETALPKEFTLTLTARVRSNAKIETTLPRTWWAIGYSKEAVNIEKPIDNITETNKLDHKNNKAVRWSTDGNGNLLWTEKFDYAHSKKSEWIVITRYIKGLSKAYTGICEIPLAINPWLKRKEHVDIQVADYRKDFHKEHHTLTERVKDSEDGFDVLNQLKAKEESHKVDVIVDELVLHRDGSDSKDNKRILEGNIIKAKLKYSIKDIHGNIDDSQIRAGEFQIQAHLLTMIKESLPDGQIKTKYIKMNENGGKAFIQTRFQNNILTSLPFDWVIPYENYNSKMALYLKIVPQGETAKRINAFEGIYFIGENFRAMVSGNKQLLSLNSILEKKYRERIGTTNNPNPSLSPSVVPLSVDSNYNNPTECLKAIQIGRQSVESCISNQKTGPYLNGFGSAGWAVEKMSLRFFQMQSENWLSRKISTIVETSVYDPMQNQKVSYHDINIEVTDLSTGVTKEIGKISELNGNISFNISTPQNWYKRQRYFLKIIRFFTKTKELKLEKIVAINPWDYGFTHGFEVNHPDTIRTTCLEGSNNPEELETEKENVFSLFASSEHIKTLSDTQIKTIYNMFCARIPNEQQSTEPDQDNLNKPHWTNIFNIFKTTLKTILRKEVINPDEDFYPKFTSSKKVKRPSAQVHLFRSINKFPTYLIDNSLTRELYYNVRFKLSPRVVRHDDIAIGQQNKGPLRDGVYVFQMAILKNDQGRFDGNQVMVQHKEDFSSYAKVKTPGTARLFSCSVHHPNCVKEDDYIVPPTNIPIVIREGMMKTDIRVRIKREYMLFANSKNILVFRLLPSDPASIVCKQRGKECTMDDPETKQTYEKGFDWKKTIKNIKPAKTSDYDMFFYTYKTPFVPSLWANWNITHELDISFEDLARQYQLIKDNKTFNEQIVALSIQIRKSSEQFNLSQEGETKFAEYVGQLTALQESAKNREFATEEQIDKDMRSKDLEKLELLANQTIERLTQYRTSIEQNNQITDREQQEILQKVDYMIGEIQNQNLSSLVSPHPTPLSVEEVEGASSTNPIELSLHPFSNLSGRENGESTLIIQSPSGKGKAGAGASNRPSNNNIYQTKTCMGIDDSPENPAQETRENFCPEDHKQENTKDLSERHIKHFASTNALCTININSPDLPFLPKSNCGHFRTSAHTGQSFLDDLNQQIEIINGKTKAVKTTYQQIRRDRDIVLPTGSDPGRSEESNNADINEDHLTMRNSYQANHDNSLVFARKLEALPDLPVLDESDLENIIQSDITKYTVNDKKTTAFLHALCGFWFDKFLSSKYTNAELLLNGLRLAVKKTFYYRMRGLSPIPEDDSNEIMKTLRTGMDELEGVYQKYLTEQKIRGQIDDLHKWVNNQEGYGFDSVFHQNLRNKLDTISQISPLKNEEPSWETSSWVKRITGRTEENIESDSTFKLAYYLNEALLAVQQPGRHGLIRRKAEDYHPVRKCLNNPSHFFGFEKKVIVGKIDKGLLYGSVDGTGGETTTLNISEDFLMNTQRDQGSNQGFDTNLGTGLTLLALPLLGIGAGMTGAALAGARVAGATSLSGWGGFLPFFKRLLRKNATAGTRYSSALSASMPIAFSFIGLSGLVSGINYSYRTYEGTGKRRWLSVRVGEGVELFSEHVPITIPLKKYHECLVIRPRFSAFESQTKKYAHIWSADNKAMLSVYKKIGILLCTEGKKSNQIIKEDYYYIYPNYTINGITIDPSGHRNKPFVISLRGRGAYKKLIHNLSCYATQNKSQLRDNLECRDPRGEYEYLFSQNIEFATSLKHGFYTPKMFHLTGNTPGIYSPYRDGEQQYSRDIKADQKWIHRFINWWTEIQFMDMDLEKIVKKEPVE